jgi:hypothetical protein
MAENLDYELPPVNLIISPIFPTLTFEGALLGHPVLVDEFDAGLLSDLGSMQHDVDADGIKGKDDQALFSLLQDTCVQQ